MSDLPGSTPEISQELPNVPDISNLTKNDSGFPLENNESLKEAIHDEFEPTEAMPDFANALMNISQGYASIFSRISDNGTFVSTEDEQETKDKFNTWQDQRTLPIFDPNNQQEAATEIESMLDKVQIGELSLNYADKASLISYFQYKYPNEAHFIDKIFADFTHDIGLVSDGVYHAINGEGGSNTKYLKKVVREWPITIFESTAQLLSKNIPIVDFNPLPPIHEIRDLFTELADINEARFQIQLDIDPQVKHITIKGNQLWFKRALYNHARNVEKYAEAHPTKNFYDQFFMGVSSDKDSLVLTTKDNRDGFRGDNFNLIDPKEVESVYTKKGTIVPRKKVFSHGTKGSDSTGSGFGTNILWQAIVNMCDGDISLRNWTQRDPVGAPTTEGKKEPTGTEYFINLPITSYQPT